MKQIKLGDLLLNAKLISQEDIDNALEIQQKTGDKFGRIIIEMGVVDEEKLLKVLAEQLNIEYIDLKKYDLHMELVQLLPETYARRYRSIVLNDENGVLLIGMADPQDINAHDALLRILKQPIKIAIVSEKTLLETLDRVYRHTKEISGFAQELSGEMLDDFEELQDDLFEETLETADQAPVVKLLNSLFRDAVQARASDIHIEPDERVLRIRLRIDGMLTEHVLDDKRIVSALVQRLKLRAHVDIAEKRIPQDGRFNFKIKGRYFDVRLSTLPTAYGEAVVMRLLDQSTSIIDLNKLCTDANIVKRLEALYSKPHGMLLVTGPTGSGKTTTLYSILQRLNTPERKIITVEDPVEYRMPRINQVQVNDKIDLTFALVLRAMLRQDPDVIMVGEIRDPETSQIAMRAAITGHFVLATLHTNDAMTSAIRLIDMGTEGYMVAAAVKGIIGQRLVRLICENCARVTPPSDNELIWLGTMGFDIKKPLKKGIGCSQCNFRGYHGRRGIYELLELDMPMLTALRLKDSEAFVAAALSSKDYRPLSQVILDMLTEGSTSVEEAIRVVGQIDDEFMRFTK